MSSLRTFSITTRSWRCRPWASLVRTSVTPVRTFQDYTKLQQIPHVDGSIKAGTPPSLATENSRKNAGTTSAFNPTLPSFSLAGKTAVITGGARGLGLAMSKALVMSGADLAIVDLNSKLKPNVYGYKNLYLFMNRGGTKASGSHCQIVFRDIPQSKVSPPLPSRISCEISLTSIRKGRPK